jgi:hypothetical protein
MLAARRFRGLVNSLTVRVKSLANEALYTLICIAGQNHRAVEDSIDRILSAVAAIYTILVYHIEDTYLHPS